ncbi:MAG: 4Fe-4S dicluster domain-containing protein [Elusimicrobia bacterium]|nr:4Fe-4S dicluster domain-containing protein [Elusimicrobiota bacterium]
MKYPKLRELKEAFKSFFSKPYTTKYPAEPHTPFPKFRGRPIPDDNECIACGACSIVCPSNAIEIKENLDKKPPTREVIWHYDLCIFCAQCELLCTTSKGVKLSLEFDLATYNRASLFSGIEKELIMCECCQTVIAPKTQFLWLINKLGPLSSGNFNLIYTAQKELKIAEELPSEVDSSEIQRPDLFRVLCPKCRHLVIVFNQTGQQP